MATLAPRAAFALAAFFAFILWLPAQAQEPRPVPPLTGRVIDATGTLTPPQVEALTAKLAAIETSRGAQIVVLMVPSTAPEDIADFTQRVGEQWKLGRAKEGDGLLIVVAKDDRRFRIAPARSLEGAVPDVVARRILAEQMAPAFRNGDWAGGLNAAVDRIDARIAGEALPAPEIRTERRQNGGAFDLENLLLFFFVGVPVLGAFLSRVLGRKLSAVATAGIAGTAGWFITASLLVAAGVGVVALLLVGLMGFGGGGRRGGGGGPPIIWGGGFGGGGGGGFGGGGGGGGFSSGGGGDFAGGGASGDW